MGESCFPYKSIQQASSTSLFPLSPVALHPSSKSVPRTHSLDCHFHIHTLPANKWSHYQQTHSVIICRRFDIYSIACCQTYEKNMDYSKADDTMKQYIWMCGSALLSFYRFGANESLFIHRKYLHMVAQIDFIICTNTHTHRASGTFDIKSDLSISSVTQRVRCVIYWPAFTISEIYYHLAIRYTQSRQ